MAIRADLSDRASNVDNVRRIYGKHRPDHLRDAAKILVLQLPQVAMNHGNYVTGS